MRRLPPLRAGGGQDAVAIFAFDILSLNGRDLRDLPLIERKRELEQVLRDSVRIRYLGHVRTDGAALYAAIEKAGLEGIVAKREDAPYRAGRSKAWLKIKTPAFRHRSKATHLCQRRLRIGL